MFVFFEKFIKEREERKRWRYQHELLSSRKRPLGVSGFMRLRNEEDFLALAIESHISSLDELVIVYNDCSDSTPEICALYADKYPQKVRVYKYEPIVYPQGSKEFRKLSARSAHSLVNYYNYALSKTTYSIAVKIDGDHAAIPELLSRAVHKIKKSKVPKYRRFRGINLWDDKGKIFVNGNRPETGGWDTGFFPVSKDTYFIKKPVYEQLKRKRGMEVEDLGVLFFHLKNLKKDRGLGVYKLSENSDSRYHDIVKEFYTEPKLLPWEEYKESNPLVKKIKHPLFYDIKPIAR